MRLNFMMIAVLGITVVGQRGASQTLTDPGTTSNSSSVSSGSMQGGEINTLSPPTRSYEYPVGDNLFDVYQNDSTGTISIISSDRTFTQEISRSDVFHIGQSLAGLDRDGSDGSDADVRYTGSWQDVSQVNVTNKIGAPEFSVDRDGSIRIVETGNFVVSISTCLGDGCLGPEATNSNSNASPNRQLIAPIEVCLSNCTAENFTDRASYFYGRETVLDPITKTLKSQTLIAYSQESYEYAISKGYDAILNDPNVRKVGSFAAPEGWAITADEVRGSTGSTLISSNAGNVSVANGSLRVSPSNSSSAPGTTISSSDDTLILGDSGIHRTIVRGTLEVQDPTAPSHAANKRYVDGATSLAMAMSSLPVSPDGGPYLGVAAGTLGGETAFALGFSHTEPASGFQMKFNLGHSASSGTGAAVGIGIGF